MSEIGQPSPARMDDLERKVLHLRDAIGERKPKGDSLCYRCANSTIQRRGSSFDYHITCHALGRMMPRDIAECSSYRRPNELSLYEMGQIATLISDREKEPGHYL